MTPLNNQELKEKIAGIYDNPEDPEYCLEDLISEKAMNQLLALFESELANRERVARIAELEVVKSQITEAHMILSPCGYRHTIDNILHPEIIEDRIAQLQSQLNKETT